MSMNFMSPYVYPATAGADLAIPSTLMSPNAKKFTGARTVIKSVPSASGSVGASSTMLFNLPTGPGTGYIKSGSMYLRCKITVVQLQTTAGTWCFAGQGKTTAQNSQFAPGGASSIIDRMVVSVGGIQCSVINNYNSWRNYFIPHATSPAFFTDLSQMEWAGIGKAFSTLTTELDVNKNVYACIPILAPIFNSESSIPTFLLNGGPISIEINTAAVNNAFYTTTAPITSYTISEASIVYESIEVGEDFKNAMRQKVATDGFYNIHLEDLYNLSIATSATVDYNIGLSLSSLKAVCWTEQAIANNTASTTSIAAKYYMPNGLSDAKIYVDNQLINNVAIDNDNVAYIEMNRALGRIYDYTTCSNMQYISSTADNNTNKKSAYCDAAFLGGVSTSVVSDWNFTSSGVPCNQLTVHLEHNNTDPTKWGVNTAFASAAVLYLTVMYDSVCSIDANGMVTMRK